MREVFQLTTTVLSDVGLVAFFDALRNPQPVQLIDQHPFYAILTRYCKPSTGMSRIVK